MAALRFSVCGEQVSVSCLASSGLRMQLHAQRFGYLERGCKGWVSLSAQSAVKAFTAQPHLLNYS